MSWVLHRLALMIILLYTALSRSGRIISAKLCKKRSRAIL